MDSKAAFCPIAPPPLPVPAPAFAQLRRSSPWLCLVNSLTLKSITVVTGVLKICTFVLHGERKWITWKQWLTTNQPASVRAMLLHCQSAVEHQADGLRQLRCFLSFFAVAKTPQIKSPHEVVGESACANYRGRAACVHIKLFNFLNGKLEKLH